MLDPTLAAAIVSAAGGVISTIIGRISRTGDSPEQSKANQVIDKTYDKLRDEMTDNNVRVLVILESGENLAPHQAHSKILRKFDSDVEIEEDLRYRMKFLCLLGLLTPVGGSEFAITKLGLSYITKAKQLRDYHNVFWN
jgi:hypothetical protein